jgi:membrane protease YdiL (CAAX protease family)
MGEQTLSEESHEMVVEQPRPWGFWPTIGFSAIIAAAFFIVQIIIVTAWTVVSLIQNPKMDIEQFAKNLTMNGLILAVFICTTAPITIILSILFAKIRKGITVRQYLGFTNPGWTEIVKWCLVVLVFAGITDAFTFFLGRPVVLEYMTSTYQTAYFLPLFWLALIVVGPLAEEIFFRGFLYEGIRHSRAGAAGAIIITSLLWSSMHGQYDLYGIVFIFMGGLILGYSRLKSHSIYPPVAMHVLQNILATIEVVVYLKYFNTTG